MKSIVALLDRKKRDRPNTLVQVPFPSLPHSSQQEMPVPLPGSRRTSTPAIFMRPSPQHRASSTSSPSRPLLFPESPAYSRGHSPAQSTSYYTDSDDGTLADPFAASALVKTDPSSSQPALGTPRQPNPRRGSEPNTTNATPPSSFRFRSVHEPSTIPPVANELPSQSGAGKKGRWLRERRSLTSLLRPQPSISTEPVPVIPSLPLGTRAPERKSSTSFFPRGRSGSTPAAHTLPKSSMSAQVQSQAAAISRQSVDYATRGKVPSHPSAVAPPMDFPVTLDAHSPDSWVRVGSAAQEQGSPSNSRRRAISVPARARPPQPTESCSPVPNSSHVPRATTSKCGHSTSTPRGSLPPARHVEMSTDRMRQNRVAHGTRSTSVSAPMPLKAGSRSVEQERPSLQHAKQLSTSGPEGLVLKSALKRRPAEHVAQDRQSSQLAQVKPLRISKRQGSDTAQIPTPSSESSLKDLHATTDQEPSADLTSPNSEGASGVAHTVRAGSTLETTGSFGNVMRGHGLSASDSRSLPVLDNIWGSFVSETAFGLPPSPVASINARNRASLSQEREVKRRTSHSPASSHSSSNSSHLSSSQGHWEPGSAPPTQPPVSTLPPVPPRPSPALPLSLGSAPRRKMSRSTANAAMLLTPPISPTGEVEFQGLDFAVTASSSNNSIQGVRTNSSQPSLTRQPVPRLTRSTSSPVIRSPVIPTPDQEGLQAPSASSWLSVKVPGSRSPSPSLASQSSSQCTPVPGTPIAFPNSTANSGPTHRGTSSGQLFPTTPDIPPSRGLAQDPISNVAISSSDSVAIMAMFPSVPSNHARLQAQEEMLDGENQDARSPLTPPVTPAWVAQAFEVHPGDGLGESRDETTSSQNPITLSGSLAQMRRQKRHGIRSSSLEHGHKKQVSISTLSRDAGAMRSNRHIA